MNFLIGLASSSLSAFMIYPIDVIKTNFQVLRYNNKTTSTYHIIKNIYKQQKFKGFYSGVSSHLMTYPIFWSVYFQFESVNINIFQNKQANKIANIAMASTVASFACNPFFVIKTRFQTENLKNKKIRYNTLIKDIYKYEGVFGFYKGLNTTIVKSVPTLMIQFPAYDLFKTYTNNIVVSSFLSKIISSAIYYPLDLIRVNQRFNEKKLSIIQACKRIYTTSGFKGFYQGCLIYNAVSIPNFILLMVFKEALTDYFKSS